MAKGITVRLGKLTEQMVSIKLSKPISLEELLKKKELEYNATIRVNGKVVSKSYKLKANDIITIIPTVEGGV